MKILYRQEIIKLEKQNQWKQILDILRNDWENNRTDINDYLCYSLELWFVLNYFEGYLRNTKDLEFNELLSQLKELYKYGTLVFKDDSYYNVYYGYMIYIMPYYFLDMIYQSPDKLVKIGHEMIKKAFLIDPIDPILSSFYKLSTQNLSIEVSRRLKYYDMILPEDSVVSKYFSNILS